MATRDEIKSMHEQLIIAVLGERMSLGDYPKDSQQSSSILKSTSHLSRKEPPENPYIYAIC